MAEPHGEAPPPPHHPALEPASIAALLRAASTALAALADTTPRLEAELLLCEATGWTRTRLIAWPEHRVEAPARARFEGLLARRLAGEPIAYLRGRQAFWSLELLVTPATLIPRPETELLVELTLERLPSTAQAHVADLGTGSGAIALALAHERPRWRLIATDRSSAALAVARENRRSLALANLDLVQADWLQPFRDHSLDAIVSNPPYVAVDDPHLCQGDLRYEPREALTPGGDGLGAYRSILADARRCLRPGGWLILEHGYDQGPAVRQILDRAGFRNSQTIPDLAGQGRVSLART